MKRNILKVTAVALALATLSATPAFAAHWGQVGSKWFYYLDDGTVAKNIWVTTEATETSAATAYWVNNDGTMAASQWVNDGTAWYYVDAGGVIMKNQLLKLNSDLYWLKEDGKMAANEWAQDAEGKWYYLQENGKAVKNGWKLIDGDYYYFLKSGVMATDALVPGGYRVGPDGKWIQK